MPAFDQDKFEHWCRLNTVRREYELYLTNEAR